MSDYVGARTEQSLGCGPGELILTGFDAVRLCLDVRHGSSDAKTNIGFKTIRRGKAIQAIECQQVMAVRQLKFAEGSAQAFATRNIHPGTRSVHGYGLICIHDHLRVGEIESESPARRAVEPIREAKPIVDWRFE